MKLLSQEALSSLELEQEASNDLKEFGDTNEPDLFNSNNQSPNS